MAVKAAGVAAPGRCRTMQASPGLAGACRATHALRAPLPAAAAAARQWRPRAHLAPTAALTTTASATVASAQHHPPLRRRPLLVAAAAATPRAAGSTLRLARPHHHQQLQQLRVHSGSAAARPSRPGRSGVAVRVSANLFARVYRIVTAFFSGVVASVEDPEKLLDKVSEEMQEDMIRMRQATAQVTASQRLLSNKQKSMQASADQWLSRAELAVRRGEEELAREALRRRKVLQEDADRMGEQVQLQTQAMEQLKANVRMLEGKLGEARSKKETLKARAASAKTSIALQEMIGGLQMTSSSSWAAFDRMEEKVASLEAQAQSAAALAAPDSLERQFAALEGGGAVEAELAALKRAASEERRRGPAAQLPSPAVPPPLAGRPLRDVFDPLERELEELRRRATRD